jgi:hypothetical protein
VIEIDWETAVSTERTDAEPADHENGRAAQGEGEGEGEGERDVP